MSKTPLPRATYIKTTEDLKALAKTLSRESLLAIDTEANSMHAYQEQVCLVQISSRSADYIIDPLEVTDMSPLASLMASGDIEKIFHAAEYDVMIMKRDFGYEFCNIFDTMIAARIVGYEAFGLGSLLKHHLGVKADKSHQRDNWGLRPLAQGSLRYAQMDTHYLPTLRDILNEELKAGGHLPEAHETFRELESLPAANGRSFDPEGYWKLGIPRTLKHTQMKILRELYLMRDEFARDRDRPSFKVIDNKVLVDIAENAPHTLRDLRKIHGMTNSQIRRYGNRIIDAVRNGEIADHLPTPPHHHPPAPEITERYIALHQWRKERAIKRGVESDIIVSKQTLWDLAYQVPESIEALSEIRGLGPWRLKTYGAELLVLMQEFRSAGD
ncbi:MAG: HRDC domain-containing protein [Aggregatilineales bacterium]